MNEEILKELKKWVKKNYKTYNFNWTDERSRGNDSDCFNDGYESGTSNSAYTVGCILGMELEEPDGE